VCWGGGILVRPGGLAAMVDEGLGEIDGAALEEFFKRYPVDDRGQDYLATSPPAVVERVLQEFQPKREGESDYSGLLTSFVKRIRQESSGAGRSGGSWGQGGTIASTSGHAAEDLARQADDFLQRYPVDDNAYDFLIQSNPEVQLKVVQEFKPKSEGDADYSALMMSFVKRCRASCGPAAGVADAATPGGWRGQDTWPARNTTAADRRQVGHAQAASPSSVEIDAFFSRYPVDERASSYFAAASAEVQAKVLQGFRAKREGESDYSAIMMSFIKKCRTEEPQAQPGPSNEELDEFFARYPVDERAQAHFLSSSPETQLKVVSEFRVKREGESDYSGLLTVFVNKCRASEPQGYGEIQRQVGGGCRESKGDGYRGDPWKTAVGGGKGGGSWNSGGTSSGSWSKGGGGSKGGAGAAPAGDIEAFFQRFPMDERAQAYLASSSLEVQERVLESFRPPREDDTDYSAPLTAYVKTCRKQLDGASEGNAWQSEEPRRAGGGNAALEAALGRFLRKYPVDERALDYLTSQPPEIVDKVMREFQPKNEGDADYSAIVMTFTKRCRGDGGSGRAYGEPPWKRARGGIWS